MPFGEKTGRSAFFADLGQEVVRLSDAPTTFINPVCIGKSIPICSDGKLTYAADLYVTPRGAIAAFFPSLMEDDLHVLQHCAGVLRTWSHKQLDAIASDYFYKADGQAALVIDVMTRMGFLSYSEKGDFYSAIDKTLVSGDFLMTVSSLPFYPIRYSRRQFIDGFCTIRGIDPDDMTSFLCELESVDGVAATSLDSKLIVSYSPPNAAYPVPLFYFQLSKNRAELFVSPRSTRYALAENGLPMSATDDIFDFFARSSDRERIKPSPEDGSIGILFLLPDELFAEVHELAERIRELSRLI